MAYMSVKKLSKEFVGRQVLRDISFEVERGQIIAILGPSGCGKTTLLRCLLGLEELSSGSITIGSKPQSTWLTDKRIGYVPQRSANFAYLTATENIGMALSPTGGNNVKKIRQILENVGLDQHADVYPSFMSGGMQQRLALARALAQPTDIIAFDESLSSLDVETRQRMQELILELWSEDKRTILFVTHDVEEALFLSSKIILMGTKPGVVRQIIDVPFAYPRQSTLRFDEEFQRLRRLLFFSIRSETIKGRLSDDENIGLGMKLGLYYWPGNSPLFYAQTKGWFGPSTLPIELISFTDNREKIDFWEKGKIDILNVTVDTAVRLLKKHPDAEIIAGLNISHGADALLSREPLTIRELRGKKIAIEKGEISEFFLRYILAKSKLKLEDVVIEDLPGDQIGAALIQGRVDAAVLWEPWLSKTLELSKAHVLASSSDYPVFADVLIAKKSFVRTNSDSIKQLREIWQQSVGAYRTYPKEFAQAVAPSVGLSTQELQSLLTKIEFFDGSTHRIKPIIKQIETIL